MIPDHRGTTKQDVPKFPTGGCDIILTSNIKNEKAMVFSFAKDTYHAIGTSAIYETQTISTKRPKEVVTYKQTSQTGATGKWGPSRAGWYGYGPYKSHAGWGPRSTMEWLFYWNGADGLTGGNLRKLIDTGVLKGTELKKVLQLTGGRLEPFRGPGGEFLPLTLGSWKWQDIGGLAGINVNTIQNYFIGSPGSYLRSTSSKRGLTVSIKDAFHQTFYVGSLCYAAYHHYP